MDTYERHFDKVVKFLTGMYYVTLSDRFTNQIIGLEMIRIYQIDYTVRHISKMVQLYTES